MITRELRQLGRYEIVREIGRGAMGIVYLANDPVIGRTLAIKTVAPPAGVDPGRYREFLARFAREARAAGNLSHPGIVTVHDAGHDAASGLSFIAMEYVAGGTLEAWLRRGEPGREGAALRIGGQLAAALAYAHGRGIVHRDLKPANVLLDEAGAAKITDFGVARLDASDLTREGQSIGSPAYMSPEQALGRVADRRSDLFSLGIILYEILAGERPFRGADLGALAYQIVHEDPIPLRALDRGLSPSWDRVASRLLAKRPEDRYDAAELLLEDLRTISLGRDPVHAPPLPEPLERTVVDEAPLAAQAAAAAGVTPTACAASAMPAAPGIPLRDSAEGAPGAGASSPPAANPAPASAGTTTGPEAAARHLSSGELMAEMASRSGAGLARAAQAAATHAARWAHAFRTRVAPRLAAAGGEAIRRLGPAAARAVEGTRTLLARVSPRLVEGSRARFVPAGVLCLTPVVLCLGWMLLRPGCVVEVDLRHGLERGRLQVFVDGFEVVDRSFHGDRRKVRAFGQDLFSMAGGAVTDSFRLRPGEHEITVKVRPDGEAEGWTRTFKRTVERGSRSELEIRVANPFVKGLGVSWDSTEDD